MRAWLALLVVACSEFNIKAPVEPEVPTTTTTTTDEEPEPFPIAVAGPAQEVAPLVDVTLDGRESYDPTGLDITEYRWQMVDRPAESSTRLDDPSGARPSFFVDVAGDYTFELLVTNELGNTSVAPDVVTISAIPADSFYVQLTWDTDTDLDLHLMRGGAQLYQVPGDCNFCNVNPNWGSPASSPSLDIDAIDGFGPETITIDEPAADDYAIRVVYYGEGGDARCPGGCPPAEATVRLYVDGALAREWRQTMTAASQVWEVATLQWPTAAIVDEASYFTTNRVDCF